MIKQWFQTLILKWTHRLWNRQISRILCRAYEERIINSEQLHLLTAAFDPTQEHHVYGEHARRGFRPHGYEGRSTIIRRA